MGISLAFALVASLSVSMAGGGVPLDPVPAGIVFWIISYFCAMNSLAHVFIREREEKTDLFLKTMAPWQAVFVSKLVFNLALFLVLQMFLSLSFVFFTGITLHAPLDFIIIALSGGTALGLVSTAMGAMVARGQGRGALMTVISFPITLPVLWSSIIQTITIFKGKSINLVEPVIFLLAFSLLVTMVSYTLFPVTWLKE